MNLFEITASDLMSERVLTCSPEDSLRSAARAMDDAAVHCLLVRPEQPRRGLAIVTCKDVIGSLEEGCVSSLDALRVRDVMTCPAITVPRELCIADCLDLMKSCAVRVVPVLDAGELVGILSFTDVLRALARDPSGTGEGAAG